jgi:hypothetical protein
VKKLNLNLTEYLSPLFWPLKSEIRPGLFKMHLSGGEANFCCNPSAIFWDVRFATLVQKQHGMLEYFLVTFRKVMYCIYSVCTVNGMWWLIVKTSGSLRDYR